MSFLNSFLNKQKEVSFTVLDLLSKSITFGIAIQEDVKTVVEDLKRKVIKDEEIKGEDMLSEVKEEVKKKKDVIMADITQLTDRVLERLNIPSREEIENLNRKVQSLSAKLKKFEDSDTKDEQ